MAHARRIPDILALVVIVLVSLPKFVDAAVIRIDFSGHSINAPNTLPGIIGTIQHGTPFTGHLTYDTLNFTSNSIGATLVRDFSGPPSDFVVDFYSRSILLATGQSPTTETPVQILINNNLGNQFDAFEFRGYGTRTVPWFVGDLQVATRLVMVGIDYTKLLFDDSLAMPQPFPDLAFFSQPYSGIQIQVQYFSPITETWAGAVDLRLLEMTSTILSNETEVPSPSGFPLLVFGLSVIWFLRQRQEWVATERRFSDGRYKLSQKPN